jgi:hypothetical protein
MEFRCYKWFSMFVFKLDTGPLVRGVDSRRDSLHSNAVLIALSNSKKINSPGSVLFFHFPSIHSQ